MNSSHRKHNRDTFFRYMTANTARLVLTNRSLRWSSPLCFNDPFDVPREINPGVSSQEFLEAVARRNAFLIEQPPQDTSNLTPRLKLIIDTIKNGISDTLKKELLMALKESVKATKVDSESLEDLRTMWRQTVSEMRILCLTENPSHVAMWFHYAGSYSGAVLELICNDELDSAWLAAQPVTYPEEKPGVYTIDGWAELITLKTEVAIKRMLHTATYTKSPDWNYEREWRIVTFKRREDTGNYYNDYPFNCRELATIFLGPLILPADKEHLLSLATHYPHTKIVDVSFGLYRELLFSDPYSL